MGFKYHTHHGACGSSDGLAVYETDGKVTGWCFACRTYVDNPEQQERIILKDEEMSEESTDYFTSIAAFPCKADNSRGLAEYSMSYFGVVCEVSTTDGTTPTAHYYPYTHGSDTTVIAYKRRTLPKDFTTFGQFKGVGLFGQAQASRSGARKLFITEGEIDAISLYQALKQFSMGTQWADLNPAVVSLPNGASAAVKAINSQISFVNSFEEVVLVFDQDEPGQQAISDVLKLIPEALVVKLPEKDANAMVMKGQSSNLAKQCLFHAQKNRPSHVATVSDLRNRALEKPEMGLEWPWPTLTKETYGIHPKKLYGFGGAVGMGLK